MGENFRCSLLAIQMIVVGSGLTAMLMGRSLILIQPFASLKDFLAEFAVVEIEVDVGHTAEFEMKQRHY
jgi:hypothetical protein